MWVMGTLFLSEFLLFLAWFDITDETNNKVYVSNLPTDITETEFVELMQKCGLVMKDPDTQKMKVKLYMEPGTESLKGDALCTYIKVRTVIMFFFLLFINVILF